MAFNRSVLRHHFICLFLCSKMRGTQREVPDFRREITLWVAILQVKIIPTSGGKDKMKPWFFLFTFLHQGKKVNGFGWNPIKKRLNDFLRAYYLVDPQKVIFNFWAKKFRLIWWNPSFSDLWIHLITLIGDESWYIFYTLKKFSPWNISHYQKNEMYYQTCYSFHGS